MDGASREAAHRLSTGRHAVQAPERRSTARARPAAPSPGQAADRVYEAIHAAVIDHRLAPGTRLPEEELARTFAVSRTLVRQALHRLAQEGVVVLHPNRGAQVPEPTREDGAHVFDARRIVECEVMRRLSGRLGRGPMAALRRITRAEARASAAGQQREAIRLSGAFHLELARLSGNPLLARMLESLLPASSLLIAQYKAPGEPMCVAHSHQTLLAALATGSAARAATEMRRHLNEIERSLDSPRPRRAPPLRDVFGPYRDAP